LLAYDRELEEHFGSPGKVPEIFINESGNCYYYF